MGRSSAVDMAEHNHDLESAITWHLRNNHFPPHPYIMIPVAMRAIKKFNKGLWNTKVRLPISVDHKVHGRLVPVPAFLESMHLEPWLNIDMVEEYNYERGNY